MSERRRIALVTRRYWPLTGPSERALAHLAAGLVACGYEPVVLTAARDRGWPERAQVGPTEVLRLPFPATPGWGLLRYLWALGGRLRELASGLAGAIVVGLEYEAYIALGVLRSASIPVVLRADGCGLGGACDRLRKAPFSSRLLARCRLAQAIVTPSDTGREELLSHGFAAENVVLSPQPVGVCEPRSADRRTAARNALANATVDLWCNDHTIVCLCLGRMSRDAGLRELVTAWAEVQERHPSACLWLIGDGPDREPLFDLLGDLGLRFRVAMPGSFDDWTDLLQAADYLIAPRPLTQHGQAVAEAAALGLPVLAPEPTEWRALTVEWQRAALLSVCLTRGLAGGAQAPPSAYMPAAEAAARHLALLGLPVA